MKKSIRTISKQIQAVEGFDVDFRSFDGNGARQRVDDYPYVNAANRSWTVAKWRDQRFWPCYWDYDVHVLDATGSPVHGRTQLDTVRASYGDAPFPVRRSPPPRSPQLKQPRTKQRVSATPNGGSRSSPAPPVSRPQTTDAKPEMPPPSQLAKSALATKPIAKRGPKVSDTVIRNHAGFIWSVADLLRGDYKQSEYGKVILPLTVIRRLDCVLEPTKATVLQRYEALQGRVENVEPVLQAVAGEQFYNTSPLDFRRLLDDPSQIAGNLRGYIAGFSPAARDIIDKFRFDEEITRMNQANLLYLVISKFADIDLHPSVVSNLEMGYLYEELIRRFSELSNETAGEHFTPREVIRLMVNLLLAEDDDALTKPGVVRTICDPACGTGGMLSIAEDHVRALNPGAQLEVFGQELNDETYAICRSDMMVKGQDASHIVAGNCFSEDGFPGRTFDYLLANPPFGVEWKKVEDVVKTEHEKLGFHGRFGAGLPRINDGSFLFLQHMISKMKPVSEGGSRVAIVFNGSPLFNGAAGSNESEIRRWIIENDWLEAVVALPDQLFYNTGINTYFWVVTNRKSPERRGTVQLVDAREYWVKMRKSLGDKRKEISPDEIDDITRLYTDFIDGQAVKILRNEAFGFQRITVEQPLRLRWEVTDDTIVELGETKQWTRISDNEQRDLADRLSALVGTTATERANLGKKLGSVPKAIEKALWDLLGVADPRAPIITNRKSEPEPDPELRDNGNVPLPAIPARWEEDPASRLASIEYRSAIEDYMTSEVLPYLPHGWVDHSKTKLGYEIPVTRSFYKEISPRSFSALNAELQASESELVHRRSAISKAGVSGLLSELETESSNLPWLARRPLGWREVKLSLVAKLGSGHTPSRDHPEWWVDCTIPWITTGEVAQMRSDRIEYITETREKISLLGIANSAAEIHPAGTVVLCRTASAGYSAIMGEDMATSQDFATWTCGPLLRPRFLLLCLRAMRNDLLGRLAMGSTHKTIYMPDIESLRVPLPSVDEQDQIVEAFWQQLNEIDAATDALEHLDRLLREYREAVTRRAFITDFASRGTEK
jgi:type I restriction enzyme M protein